MTNWGELSLTVKSAVGGGEGGGIKNAKKIHMQQKGFKANLLATVKLTLREGRCPALHRGHCILILQFLRGERKPKEDAHRNRKKKQLWKTDYIL